MRDTISNLSRQRKSSGKFAHFFADSVKGGFVGAILQGFRHQIGNLEHFFFFHCARGDSWCADADTARFERRAGVERDGVFVDGDPGAIENFLSFFAVEVLGAKIDKHQMIVGAA